VKPLWGNLSFNQGRSPQRAGARKGLKRNPRGGKKKESAPKKREALPPKMLPPKKRNRPQEKGPNDQIGAPKQKEFTP